MKHRFSPRAFASPALCLALTFLAACSHDTVPVDSPRTVRFELAAAYAPVAIAGTTMTAARMPASRKTVLSTSVRDVPPGVMLVHFARPQAARSKLEKSAAESGTKRSGAPRLARAKVVVRSSGLWVSPSRAIESSCVADLEATEAWRECRIDIPRGMSAAEIEVEISANAAVAVTMSEISFVADSRDHPPVFVLVLDAARFDRLLPFSDVVPVGRNLQALAADGVVFTNVRSSSSWTRPAVASLLTGLRTDRHRVYGRLDGLGPEAATLGEVLQRAGYYTRAWSANSDILPAWGFARGFDAFSDVGAQSRTRAKTDAGELLDRFERTSIAEQGVATAYYLHFMDPHAPYRPPESYADEVAQFANLAQTFPGSADVDSLVSEYGDYKLYLGELLDLDRALGRFVAELRRRGVYDDALILVVADHGEEFLDHGGTSHGRTLFDEVIRIPAVLKLPGLRDAGREVPANASIEDLFATTVAALGLKVPAGLDGVDLLAANLESPRPQFSVLRLDGRRLESVVDPPWKLTVDRLNRTSSLFDLSADPGERQDVFSEHPETAATLTALIEAGRNASAAGWHFEFCGSEHPLTFELEIEGDVGAFESSGLEPADRVELATVQGVQQLRVSMALEPYSRTRLDLGEARDVDVEDRDGLRLPAIASSDVRRLVVGHPRGVPFRAALGDEKTVFAGRDLDLSKLLDRASVSDGALIECPPTGDEKRHRQGWREPKVAAPFVRIWYVPPTERRAQSDLAPDAVERLRALGYLD